MKTNTIKRILCLFSSACVGALLVASLQLSKPVQAFCFLVAMTTLIISLAIMEISVLNDIKKALLLNRARVNEENEGADDPNDDDKKTTKHKPVHRPSFIQDVHDGGKP
jgi:hypothetical protein